MTDTDTSSCRDGGQSQVRPADGSPRFRGPTARHRGSKYLDGRLQRAANAALSQGLLEYDARHGYRESERHSATGGAAGLPERVLADLADVGGLVLAVVTSVNKSTAVAWARDGGPVEIGFESMEWAAPYIDENHRGDAPKGAGAQALQSTAC